MGNKHQKPKKDNEQKEENKKQSQKIFLSFIAFIIILALIATAVIFVNKQQKNEQKEEIAYTQLLKDIADKKIEKIEMTVGSTSIKVKYKDQQDFEKEKVNVPQTQAFIEKIQEEVKDGNDIQLIQQNQSVLVKLPEYVVSLLPTAIMVALLVIIMKMQGLGEKGEVYEDTERKTRITFDDIAGLDEEKSELIEIVEFLKRPKKFTEMGAKTPRGILLYGKPGTGKTLIAKAIAGEAKVPFISMSGSEFIEMFAGLGASRVRKLFDKARKLSPCIVFIDEIDAIRIKKNK